MMSTFILLDHDICHCITDCLPDQSLKLILVLVLVLVLILILDLVLLLRFQVC